MSGFEPGDGWREATAESGPRDGLYLFENGVVTSRWVREAPVPPLPTGKTITLDALKSWNRGVLVSTDAEKLAKLTALCDERVERARRLDIPHGCFDVRDVLAILAEPGPTVPAHDMNAAMAEQYGEQLEEVGEELDRWKREVRLVGKNREHAERLEDILEGERS